MDTLFTAAGTAAAATLLFCLVRIRRRRSRPAPARVDPAFRMAPELAWTNPVAVAPAVATKPFLLDSTDEWKERVALGYGQEKGILAEIWDALPEGGDRDDWLRRHMRNMAENRRYKMMGLVPRHPIYTPRRAR